MQTELKNTTEVNVQTREVFSRIINVEYLGLKTDEFLASLQCIVTLSCWWFERYNGKTRRSGQESTSISILSL